MIFIPILIPLITGLIILFLKKSKVIYFVSLTTTILCLTSSVLLLTSPKEIVINWIDTLNLSIVLSNNSISTTNVLLCCFFAFIVVFFSKNVLQQVKENIYFSFVLLILSFANIILFSKNLLVFLICWEILGILVYLMIRFTTQKDEFVVATKALTILGITDFCLFLGIILLIIKTNNYIIDNINLNMQNDTLIFTLLTIGALGKVGSVPFHNWIPDTAEKLPSALCGYLVGALDKIIGIYWLIRITKDIFIPTQHTFLMLLGALTILIAVFMALQQHNLKKLLSYHAISQIGYMIVGISTGTTLGIVGGSFHMLNHTIYKTLLFLSSDIIEKTGNVELSQPKGLARFLPCSFVFTIIAALSISGIPPLNGFFSKWLIYQSLVEKIIITKSIIIILVLISAMFGSALTLASFVKVLYSLFLSKQEENVNSKKEISEKFYFILPMGILALLCLVFGVFAYEVPLKYIIKPMINFNNLSITTGEWNSKVAFYLVILGILLGFIAYFLFLKKPRKVRTYLLGEEEKLQHSNIPSTDFYLSITETYPFSLIYHFAEQKLLDFYNWFYGILSLLALITKSIIQIEIFDIYILGKKIVFKIGENLSKLHNGNLHFYLSWMFFGVLILLLILIL